jgi:hypothetical protein
VLGCYGFPAPAMTPELTREAVNRAALHADGLAEVPAVSGPTTATLPAAKADHVDRAKLTNAAWRARKAYPGPVGEVVSRELTEWAEFGWRLGGDSRIAKLVAAVMAIPYDELPPAA